ncbi:MAG: hypothetical protein RMN52_09510 [Anaerolineae bacterium]|nr:hypothetical protein [Candidatus Roseilinea sp.]MDW8450230.1 hypothetical protein [Anaerolineae bacterium]
MTTDLRLEFTLASDATFGRGDGVAGLLDEEIEYDEATGLPFLRGRTLKGLLVEECAALLFALERQNHPKLTELQGAARQLFGNPGSTLEDDGLLHVGHAQLPEDLRRAVAADVEAKKLSPADVLESLTAIRRQTSINEAGAPARGSLRSMRVLVRELTLTADLRFDSEMGPTERALLAACSLALRRAGTGRNRGRGRLKNVRLFEGEHDITGTEFEGFKQLIEQEAKR